MIVAAFETSSRIGSVALLVEEGAGEDSEHVIRCVRLENQRRHASELLPTLDVLLTEAGIDVQDLDAVCVGIGPGSYTGLRVGVATALGLSLATDASLHAVPSFEALAFEHGNTNEDYCVALDARAKGWYFARYRPGPKGIDVLEAPCLLTPSLLVERMRAASAASIDHAVADLLRGQGLDPQRFRKDPHPSAEHLLRLSLRGLRAGLHHTPFDCEPLYLRPFPAKPRRR